MAASHSHITMRMIAKEAGVSLASVSRVLSGSTHASAAVRNKVLSASKALGYTPSSIEATSLSKDSRLIGLVANKIPGNYVASIEAVSSASGYDLLLASTGYNPEKEERAILSMLNRHVDGLILRSGRSEYPAYLLERMKAVPVVFISGTFHGLPREKVITIDNRYGSVIGTRYLCELGHRKIAFFGRCHLVQTHMDRGEGYLDVCREYGIKPEFVDVSEPVHSFSERIKVATDYLRHFDLPSAVVCVSDNAALCFLQAADSLGIRIPRDISVIGFENQPFASIDRINLTTLRLPQAEASEAAIRWIMNITDENPSDSMKSVERFLPELIVRGSCMRIN